MSIIRKHKRERRPSVTRNKKQGGKNNIKCNGSKKKSTTKRKSGNKKTRRRRGGNPDEERKKQIMELMKQWKPVKGKGSLPDIPARKIATNVKETEAKEFKDFLREHVRSFDPKWRREDEFTAYRQNPRNIGLGKPFTAEQVVRYYADGFRNSEVRPDGLEKTLPGTTQEWYMLLPGGGWGNHPSERKGPFSANEIGNFIFTNTKLVDRSIPEKDWRPQTLSAYLRGEGRRLGPRTSLGYRPAGALKALRTERDIYKKGWVSGGGKRKTRKRSGGDDDGGDKLKKRPWRRLPPLWVPKEDDGGENSGRGWRMPPGGQGNIDHGDGGGGDQGGGRKKTRRRRGGNDDEKKSYEQKRKDYEIELADHNKTVDDSYAPMAPRERPSWASPTASGWAVAPYNRTQVLVPPERPIDPSAGPAARPSAGQGAAGPAARPATRPAAGDNENYRTNQFDGPIRGPPLTPEQRAELERTLREIEEEEREEEYEREQERDSKIRGLYGRRW